MRWRFWGKQASATGAQAGGRVTSEVATAEARPSLGDHSGTNPGSNQSRRGAEAQESSAGTPLHVAIIMDGNGRWAKERLLPRVEGHRAGAKAVRMVIEESRRLGIRYLTLFCFSTENWLRPGDEVSALMKLFCQYVESERDLLLKHGIRLRAIGERARLPTPVQESLARIEHDTAGGREMDLLLALSYGGRDEIVSAAKKIALRVTRGEITPDAITAETVRAHLYAPDVPDPEVLIRTSDECRISNFLLWQLAYTELVVTSVYWPAFSKEEFARCLAEYASRRRRFGKTDEQCAPVTGSPSSDLRGAGDQKRCFVQPIADRRVSAEAPLSERGSMPADQS